MGNVLIVDDDEMIRSALRMVLEEANYQVSEDPDGITALATLCATMEPTVVLLDLMMPGMDGSRLLRIIAENPDLSTRHAYILLTANVKLIAPLIASLPSEVAKSILLMHKPFEIDMLLFFVQQATQRLTETRAAALQDESETPKRLLSSDDADSDGLAPTAPRSDQQEPDLR